MSAGNEAPTPAERRSERDGVRAAELLSAMRETRDGTHDDDPARWRLVDGVDRLRRRVRTANPIAVVVAGFTLLVVALVVAVLFVRSRPVSTRADVVPVTVPSAAPSTTVQAGIVVHAGGAVRQPGVHRLPQGSRIVDLLERAGGPDPALDLDRVNLAAQLTDGQRVWFPRTGETAPSVIDGGAGSGGASGSIDVNTASAEELDRLPGIGPALAAAIVTERTRRGPFRSLDDLQRVKGISRSKIDALAGLASAG